MASPLGPTPLYSTAALTSADTSSPTVSTLTSTRSAQSINNVKFQFIMLMFDCMVYIITQGRVVVFLLSGLPGAGEIFCFSPIFSEFSFSDVSFAERNTIDLIFLYDILK